MQINGVNFDILCEYLKEYFETHTALENYNVVNLIMTLIEHSFDI